MFRLRRLPFILSMMIAFGLSVAPCAMADPFNINLIVNGNAEAGAGSPTGAVVPIPGWTTSGNITVVTYANVSGFPTAADPGPPDRGANFFAGGNNASSSALQLIDLSSGAATIDLGTVRFDLTGYLGGFSTQNDNAVLTASFRDASSAVLSMTSIGPVLSADRGGATGLFLRTTSGFVPIGTREVQIMLQMMRTDGSYNDGYADSLSLTLTPMQTQAVPEPATMLLLGTGLAGLAARARKRRKS